MLRIRLSRAGKKNSPHYSIVVTEKTNPACDGSFLEKLGYFNPLGKNTEFKVDLERVKYWISVGAKPTETMARLLHKEGLAGMDKYVDIKKRFQKKPKKESGEEDIQATEKTPSAEAAADDAEKPLTEDSS